MNNNNKNKLFCKIKKIASISHGNDDNSNEKNIQRSIFICRMTIFVSLFFTSSSTLLYGDIIKYPNGDIYNGNTKRFGLFFEKIPHGQGEYVYKNGDKYIGGFKDGKMDGQGELFYKHGDYFKGNYKDGKRNGDGIYNWGNGSSYKGEYKDNLPDGEGMLTRKDSTYIGNFTKGVRTGYGKLIRKNSIVSEGIFEGGKLIKSKKQIEEEARRKAAEEEARRKAKEEKTKKGRKR